MKRTTDAEALYLASDLRLYTFYFGPRVTLSTNRDSRDNLPMIVESLEAMRVHRRVEKGYGCKSLFA